MKKVKSRSPRVKIILRIIQCFNNNENIIKLSVRILNEPLYKPTRNFEKNILLVRKVKKRENGTSKNTTAESANTLMIVNIG
ncbi:hypothetical protein CYCD_18710 [Tenuifilaceae bacterium CYCD]|nr:hypothetical protein CYCD_18710 [Tenuifilaceae bacterium CYCD]